MIELPQKANASAVDQRTMRDVLGHFVSGIVIVTGEDEAGPTGFTCQSFFSLSIDPPLVTFSPSRKSSTWPRLRKTGRFCVNVLAADHADLSAAFARPGGDRFAGVSWSPSPAGSPALDGVSAWIDCAVEGEYDGGDHLLVIGRVLALGADPDRPPLLYYGGGYRVTAPLPPTEPVGEWAEAWAQDEWWS